MGKVLVLGLCMVLLCIIGAEAQTQHVAGEDRGWDPNSDLASWSHRTLFRVGDNIWFTYSAAHENIVELKSKEEYEACDVSNPIRMLTNGLDALPLEEEGIRYFVSGNFDSCKNGLKLHVDVQSQSKPNDRNATTSKGTTLALADGPTTPSASMMLSGISFGFFIWLPISYFAI